MIRDELITQIDEALEANAAGEIGPTLRIVLKDYAVPALEAAREYLTASTRPYCMKLIERIEELPRTTSFDDDACWIPVDDALRNDIIAALSQFPLQQHPDGIPEEYLFWIQDELEQGHVEAVLGSLKRGY